MTPEDVKGYPAGIPGSIPGGVSGGYLQNYPQAFPPPFQSYQPQYLPYTFAAPTMADPCPPPPPPQVRCTCLRQLRNHIPRPRNLFMLFRQQYHQDVVNEKGAVKNNPDVLKELGRRWRLLGVEEKKVWQDRAAEEKRLHQQKHPNYRYAPRRNKKLCPVCSVKGKGGSTEVLPAALQTMVSAAAGQQPAYVNGHPMAVGGLQPPPTLPFMPMQPLWMMAPPLMGEPPAPDLQGGYGFMQPLLQPLYYHEEMPLHHLSFLLQRLLVGLVATTHTSMLMGPHLGK